MIRTLLPCVRAFVMTFSAATSMVALGVDTQSRVGASSAKRRSTYTSPAAAFLPLKSSDEPIAMLRHESSYGVLSIARRSVKTEMHDEHERPPERLTSKGEASGSADVIDVGSVYAPTPALRVGLGGGMANQVNESAYNGQVEMVTKSAVRSRHAVVSAAHAVSSMVGLGASLQMMRSEIATTHNFESADPAVDVTSAQLEQRSSLDYRTATIALGVAFASTEWTLNLGQYIGGDTQDLTHKRSASLDASYKFSRSILLAAGVKQNFADAAREYAAKDFLDRKLGLAFLASSTKFGVNAAMFGDGCEGSDCGRREAAQVSGYVSYGRERDEIGLNAAVGRYASSTDYASYQSEHRSTSVTMGANYAMRF